MKTSMILAAGAAVAALACGSTASATAPAASWSGFYAGATADYGFGQGKFSGKSGLPTSDISGGGVGLNVGWNWQMDRWVLGLEGAVSYQGIEGTKDAFDDPFKTQVSFVGDIRGRVGYLCGPWLVYGVTGPSFGTGKGTIFDESATKSVTGWSGGVGAEYALMDGWSVRGEYVYTGFQKTSAVFNLSDTVTLNRIQIGIEKRF